MSAFGITSERLNIYSYALAIPNLIFTCVGTSLTTVVVPIYSSMLAKGEHNKSKEFLNALLTLVTLVLLALVIISELIAPFILGFSKYAASPDSLSYAVFVLRTLLPVMLFHGVNFIMQGVLQSHGKFKLTAFVTVPSALTLIAYTLLLGDKYGVTGLVYATFAGLALQALILIPSVVRSGYSYRPSFAYRNENLKLAAKLTLPVLLGVFAYQFTTLFSMTLATRYNAVTILSYVQNIILVSVLTIIYSITNVYYPHLSVLWSEKKIEDYKKTLAGIFKAVFFLMVPVTAGFILLRFRLFEFMFTLFGKLAGSAGASDDVSLAGNIMGFYSAGIVFVCLKEILDRAFYSQKKTKIPAIVGIVIMASNIGLSLVTVNFIGINALALSSSCASLIGSVCLYILLVKGIGPFGKDVFGSLAKSGICTAFMVVCVKLVMTYVSFKEGIAGSALNLIIPVFAGLAAYFAIAAPLNASILKEFFGKKAKNVR